MSHSSTEAEIVALETAVRVEGIPVVAFWDVVRETLQRPDNARTTPRRPKEIPKRGSKPIEYHGELLDNGVSVTDVDLNLSDQIDSCRR